MTNMERGVVSPDKTSGQDTNDSRSREFESFFQQIIGSETFKLAPITRGLLLYLWRQQGKSISEFAIGVEALGRTSDFDPKFDSTVRVGIGRLRTRLKEFYDREMPMARFQLTIPLGGHELLWVPGPQPPSRFSVILGLPLFYRNMLLALTGLAAGLAIVSTNVILENHALKAPPPVPQLPRLWSSFLVGNKNPIVIVPSPLFFQWAGDNMVIVRDVGVSQYQDWPSSPFILQIAKQLGPPKLAQAYIPIEAVTSAPRILNYLESMGRHPELRTSSNLGAELFGSQNTMFLGPTSTYVKGDHVKRVMERTNFYIHSTLPSIVRNRNPGPGEVAEYTEVEFSATHRVVPGLLFLLPTTSKGTRSLFLIGRNTSAFTSILLSADGLKLLDEQWKKSGSPDFWEVVFQAEINGDTVLKFQTLAIRKIAPNFWE